MAEGWPRRMLVRRGYRQLITRRKTRHPSDRSRGMELS